MTAGPSKRNSERGGDYRGSKYWMKEARTIRNKQQQHGYTRRILYVHKISILQIKQNNFSLFSSFSIFFFFFANKTKTVFDKNFIAIFCDRRKFSERLFMLGHVQTKKQFR